MPQENKAEDHKHAFDLPDGHGHFNGDGFEKHGDKIELSPGRTEWSRRISAKREAVASFIRTTDQFVTNILTDIETEQTNWWNAVIADLGLQRKPERERLRYSAEQVSLAPPPEAKKENAK